MTTVGPMTGTAACRDGGPPLEAKSTANTSALMERARGISDAGRSAPRGPSSLDLQRLLVAVESRHGFV
jgi:hypothetical protein